MKVNKKKNADGTVTLDVVATAEDVNKAFGLAEIEFANSMGLQPQNDKTIEEVAKETMGITNIDSVISDSAVEVLVPMAIEKSGIYPAFAPQPKPTSTFKRGRDFSFTVEVTPKPEYELTSYDPVEIVMPSFAINEEEVEAQIKQIADQNKSYENIDDRPLEKGDSCLIAVKCFEDGNELKGITSDGRTYVSGEGHMPSGFDDNIIGMVPGETREFTFEAPSFDEDYNPVTKEIECIATLKAIQEPVEPVIDDAWVQKTLPMYKSLDDLRGDIRKSIEQRDRQQYENYKMQMVANALTNRFEGSIADEIYMNARENLMQQIQMDLRRQGKTWEDFVQENGGEQQVGMMLMLQTRETVVQGFVLDAIFRHEHLKIADQDIDEVCFSMNPQANPKQIRQQIEAAGQGFVLREAAERMVANKWAAEHAIVKEQGE